MTIPDLVFFLILAKQGIYFSMFGRKTEKETNTANANKQTSQGKPRLTSKRSVFVQNTILQDA